MMPSKQNKNIMREFNNVAELADCVGEEIGVNDWFSGR